MKHDAIPSSPGIYLIYNIVSKSRYIGSSGNLYQRMRSHITSLRKGVHANPHLQAAWRMYGEDAFVFLCLEPVESVDDLIPREQHWIDTLKPEYNKRLVAHSNRGLKASEETRRKLLGRTAHNKGKPWSPEFREKVMAARSASEYKQSPETLAKIANAHRGRKRPPGTGTKISAGLTGRKLSPEHCAKMSASRRGIPRNPESVAKMVATMKGHETSPETRAKIGAANKGRKQSPEQIAKAAAARRKTWEAKQLAKEQERLAKIANPSIANFTSLDPSLYKPLSLWG